jgi:DNA-binding NarL/FixJ family response regulator
MKGASPQKGHRRHIRPRELQVLRLRCSGLRDREIARQLHISPCTVKNYMQCVYEVSGCTSKEAVGVWAFQQGYFNPEAR